MEKVGIDGFLITSTYNRRYMTNFTGSAGVVLISQKEANSSLISICGTSGQAGRRTMKLFNTKEPSLKKSENRLKEMKIEKLGFEQEHLTFATYKAYETAIDGQLLPVSGVIENLRLIKTASEIKILKEAADYCRCCIYTYSGFHSSRENGT